MNSERFAAVPFIILGVCGMISAYFGHDGTLWIMAGVLTLLTTIGFLINTDIKSEERK